MRVMILGAGISGRAVFDYFSSRNIDCFFASEKDINAEKFEENYLDELLKNVTLIIASPGISPKKELVFQIKKRKVAFFGEFEFATSKLENDIIAVTGTNGKTTTVSLIHYLLKDYYAGAVLGGNVGIAVTSLIDKILSQQIAVLECSSFQLETVKNFKPHIAMILNITKDHLNRHGTMREYIKCKYKITKKQTSEDFLILNADDEILRKNPPKTKAEIYYFSTKRKVVGSYIKNNCIYFNDNDKEIKLANLSRIKLKGEHNLSNILAAVLAVYLETKNLDLVKNIDSFLGVPHRIEFVKTIDGVEFYNDSKATNIASTLVALKSFKNPINLILGGSDKGYGFDELFEKLPKNVKNIAVFGQTRSKIAFFAKKYKYKNIYICANLQDSVKLLFSKSKRGDVILLSPACASFDFFSGFEERGNFFKKIVKGIDEDESSIAWLDEKKET